MHPDVLRTLAAQRSRDLQEEAANRRRSRGARPLKVKAASTRGRWRIFGVRRAADPSPARNTLPSVAMAVDLSTTSNVDSERSDDEDPSLLFTGLPDNACQARHWGVVLEGTLVFRYTDNSEDVIEAGEAYYAPPGHLPLFKTGTRLIEFRLTDELDKTMETVMVNVAAIQAG
jgi:hypothetical protein